MYSCLLDEELTRLNDLTTIIMGININEMPLKVLGHIGYSVVQREILFGFVSESPQFSLTPPVDESGA